MKSKKGNGKKTGRRKRKKKRRKGAPQKRKKKAGRNRFGSPAWKRRPWSLRSRKPVKMTDFGSRR